MAVQEILERLSEDWSTPQPGNHHGQATVFKLRCSVRSKLSASGTPESSLPTALEEFWRVSSGATLFEDVEFGQWGLVLLSPAESASATQAFREERARDYVSGDRVLGRFLGDQDLLVVRCDETADDFGSIVVALPLDRRRDWYRVAEDLEAFLGDYERNQGSKYWEETGPSTDVGAASNSS